MGDIAAQGNIDESGRTASSGDAPGPDGAQRAGAGSRRRRPRAAAGRRLVTEPKDGSVPGWLGGRKVGLVCCVEIREAVTVHIRLDGVDKHGELDRGVSAYQPFTLTTTSGVCTLDPRVRDDVDRGGLAPLIRLTRRRAYEPEWSEDGQAVIRFEDGSLLTYPAHPTETSWMLTGWYGETWSSRPGGRVVRNEYPPTTSIL